MNIEKIEVDAAQRPRPRKANECIIDPKRFFFRPLLFDEFWREGELALVFGAPGTGKSVLAVQIADALARGTPLDGFRMPAGRRKVLYVDLVLQDAQFQARYSYFPPNSWYVKSCKFAENLHWDRPPSIDELVEWLSKTVREDGFQVVIIDDLSAVKRTHDGVRETLALMRQLKRLRDELGVSILAIAGSDEPGWDRTVSEHDLKRSRILCSVADSVFAIGDASRDCDAARCIVQTRSRNSSVFWKEHNAPTGHITRLENGMLGFRFDERFTPRIDAETRRLICRIRSMREAGTTYRAIAKELRISKTQAARLYKKWTPALGEDSGQWSVDSGQEEGGAEWSREESEPGAVATGSLVSTTCGSGWGLSEEEAAAASALQRSPRSKGEKTQTTEHTEHMSEPGAVATGFQGSQLQEPEEWEEAELQKPIWLEAEQPSDEPPEPVPREPDIEPPPKRPSVYDLKRGIDGYGREIFIESEDEWHDGRPELWYQQDRKGNYLRFERDLFGVNIKHIGSSPFL